VVRGWVLPWLSLALACSGVEVDSARTNPAESVTRSDGWGTELIPAEWTIAEDTSSTGEVITTSMQLPAAREIDGLTEEETPRLLLQCVDGKIAAFIDTPSDSLELDADPVSVPLDSAPACE
jgi:hypothetical protein